MNDPAGDPFEALGDANRREIVEMLRGGGRSVREIADALPISRPSRPATFDSSRKRALSPNNRKAHGGFIAWTIRASRRWRSTSPRCGETP